MALNSGWKKKEAALEQRTSTAEASAAAARDTVADAIARAEEATQVCIPPDSQIDPVITESSDTCNRK